MRKNLQGASTLHFIIFFFFFSSFMQTAPAAPGLGSCVAGVRINVELGCVFLYAGGWRLKIKGRKKHKKTASIAKNKQKLQQHLGGVETLHLSDVSTRSDGTFCWSSCRFCTVLRDETAFFFFFKLTCRTSKKLPLAQGRIPNRRSKKQCQMERRVFSVGEDHQGDH